MPPVLPIKKKLKDDLLRHGIRKKFDAKAVLITTNINHPGLHVEKLEPKEFGVYSFRIDRKYRALFVFRPDKDAIEILSITVHYN